jgi:Phytanoyl-CoA dioxygenase (PhyH)
VIPDGFERDGYCVIEGVLTAAEVAALLEVAAVEDGQGGPRNLLDVLEIKVLAGGPAVRGIVDAILGPGAKAVRVILFDKTSDANWKVPWHQDVTIAVNARVNAEGYGPGSTKAGKMHVHPPAGALERMVSVRIHLDDCPEANGALQVVAGSHRMGKIVESGIASVVEGGTVAVCEVGVGGVLVMRPLLVHSSSAAIAPGHRRVIHFDFAVGELADVLVWAMDRSGGR